MNQHELSDRLHYQLEQLDPEIARMWARRVACYSERCEWGSDLEHFNYIQRFLVVATDPASALASVAKMITLHCRHSVRELRTAGERAVMMMAGLGQLGAGDWVFAVIYGPALGYEYDSDLVTLRVGLTIVPAGWRVAAPTSEEPDDAA